MKSWVTCPLLTLQETIAILPLTQFYGMVKSLLKTSVSKGNAIDPEVLEGGEIVDFRFLPAISYTRVSTKRQTEESKSGLVRQDDGYIHWLVSHPNYRNLEGYVCRDLGVSGRGTNRTKGALSVLLKDARLGNLPTGTCVVVENMTRLTRDAPREAYKLILSMFDYGLTIAFTQWGGKVFEGSEDDPTWLQIMGAILQASKDWKHKQGLQKGVIDKVNK